MKEPKKKKGEKEQSSILLHSFAPIRWNAINFSLYAKHAHRRKVDLTSFSSTWPYCDAPFLLLLLLPFGYPSKRREKAPLHTKTKRNNKNNLCVVLCAHAFFLLLLLLLFCCDCICALVYICICIVRMLSQYCRGE